MLCNSTAGLNVLLICSCAVAAQGEKGPSYAKCKFKITGLNLTRYIDKTGIKYVQGFMRAIYF